MKDEEERRYLDHRNAFRFQVAGLIVSAFTLVAVVAYTYVTYRQSATLDRQLKVMQKQTELSERPWITSEIAPANPITPNPEGSSMAFGFLLKNVGKSVAVGIDVHAQLMAVWGPEIFTEPLRLQTEMCDKVRAEKKDSARVGIALFPNEQTYTNWSSSLSNSQIEKNLIPGRTGKHFVAIYYGCIDYQFTFSPDHHQTRFIYEVSRRSLNDPYHPASLEMGKAVPRGDIILERYFFGGNYPD